MSAPLDLEDPVAVLLAVRRALHEAGHQTAIYGGLALAIYGTPRETKDADFAVAGVSARAAQKALQHAGIAAMTAFDRTAFGGNIVVRLSLLGTTEAPGINVADLVEPRSPRYARIALDRALEGELRGEMVQVLAPEDFVLFKVLSTRERDLEDALSVLVSLADRLDSDLLSEEAEALAKEIGDHDVRSRWRRLEQMVLGETP